MFGWRIKCCVSVENPVSDRFSEIQSASGRAWLVLSALSLAVGIWACVLIGVTSVQLINLPYDAADVTFASNSFLAILVAFPASLAAFVLVSLLCFAMEIR